MNENLTYKIQPEILTFMRESSGMSEDAVAKKLKLSTKNYINIEQGVSALTQNHLIQLADIYKRPLIAFYSNEAISIPNLPHDYRLNRDKKISPEIFLAKRKGVYLSEQLKDVSGRKSELPQIEGDISPVKLADEISKLLKVDYNFITTFEEPIINYYKSIVEEIFFIPVIEHPLKSSGVRAFSIYNDVCVIILNESDTREVKLFSLFHELCHLLKRQEGICSIDIEKDRRKNTEESYCDEFAANILVPQAELRNRISGPIESLSQVSKIAKSFGVSNLVTSIRLKDTNFINTRTFNGFRKLLKNSIKKGFGRRNWENTHINRTSRLILGNLINSYKKGDLTYSSLASITGIKDKYLQKFI